MLKGLPPPLPTFMSRKPEVSVAERSCGHRVPFPVRGNVPSDGCEIEIKHKTHRHLPFRFACSVSFSLQFDLAALEVVYHLCISR